MVPSYYAERGTGRWRGRPHAFGMCGTRATSRWSAEAKKERLHWDVRAEQAAEERSRREPPEKRRRNVELRTTPDFP